MIYAIQAGEFVKLGFSDYPKKRLQEIQVSSPSTCLIIGIMEGTIGTERTVHNLFSAIRVRGEWFRLTPELKSWIDSNMQPTEVFFPDNPRVAASLATNSKSSKRIGVRLELDSRAVLKSWCEENDMSLSEGFRVALDRLFEEGAPTREERERCHYQIGRPKASP